MSEPRAPGLGVALTPKARMAEHNNGVSRAVTIFQILDSVLDCCVGIVQNRRAVFSTLYSQK
jgi:hypothetical protein